MAVDNDLSSRKRKALNLGTITSKLEATDKPPVVDKSDIVSDKRRPVKQSKGVRPQSRTTDHDVPVTQIRSAVQHAFNNIERQSTGTSADTLNTKKENALANISTTISRQAIVERAYTTKLKSKALSGKKTVTKSTAKNVSLDISDLLQEQINQQTNAFISQKARELARNRVIDAQHLESTTILSQILSISRRNNAFFEGSFSQYLITSTELKLKHILVTKDILKYTKQITNIIAPKIDAVKHNTSLPDDNKSTIFEDIGRSVRTSALRLVGQSIIAPLKKPLTDLIQSAVDKVKTSVSEKMGIGTNSVEFGGLVQPQNKFVSKTHELIGKVQGKQGRSFFNKDMTEVSPETTMIGKFINDAAKKRMQGFKNLDAMSEDEATFDNITRRSIVEIIPGFLAKIHSESASIAEMVRAAVRRKIAPDQRKDFDKASVKGELVFDRKTGSFIQSDQLGKSAVEDVFGTKESNTKAVEGVIRKLRSGFIKHGGDDQAFDQALPDIVRFVTNIGKHAKIVKLDNIKKYLNGEDLSEFDQAYLDAILTDIPKSSHKRIVELLGTAFFSDKKQEVDIEASSSIGEEFKKLSMLHEEDAQRMNRAANLGDARFMSQVYDGKTGKLDHDAVRSIKNDVDIDELRRNVKSESPRVEELKQTVSSILKDSLDKFSSSLKNVVPADLLKDINLAEFSQRVSKQTADAISRTTGIPNRDASQVSGPGVYIQGAQRELHVPLDDLKGNIKKRITSIISNVEDSLKSYNKPSQQQPSAEAYTSRVDFKGEEPKPYVQQQDTSEKILTTVTGIATDIKTHFSQYVDVEERKFAVLNNILESVMSGGTGVPGEGTQEKKRSFGVGSVLRGTARAGSFVAKKYAQGWMKLTGGLLGLTGKLAKGTVGLAKGAFDKAGAVASLLKGGGKLTAKVLGGLLGVNAKIAGTLLRSTFGVGKAMFKLGAKLFTKNKHIDVYKKDDVSVGNPLVKGIDIKLNRYRFADGRVLPDSFSITQPVYDTKTEQVVITAEDIEHGLVDVNNKPLQSRSIVGSLVRGTARGAKFLVGAQLRLTGKVLSTGFNAITALLSKLPGIKGITGKFKGKGTVGQVDSKILDDKVTKHLLHIIKLIKPISDNFKGIREGSYDDYKRDRLAELANQRKRAKGVVKQPGKEGAAGKAAAAGGLASLLGFDLGSIKDTISEGLESLEGLGDLKKFFKKKGASTIVKTVGTKAAQGAATAASGGMFRSAVAGLGRLGIGQAARSAAVYGATALAGAVSAPVVATGLAVAGLGAGGYGIYKWYKGSERRKSITQVRNEVYRVPELKMDTLIDFEDDIFESMEDDNSGTMTKEIADYIRKFGFSPSDNDQYDFFKHWYSNLFFPVFKASCDIFKNMGVTFADQTDLTDEQLAEYKQALENTEIWGELLDRRVELSLEGFGLWKGAGKKTIERDESGKDKLTGKVDATGKILGTKAGKLGMSYMSTYDAVRNQVEEQKAREDMALDSVGEGDPTAGLSSMWQGIKSGAKSAASSVAAGASWVGDKASSAASAVGDAASGAASYVGGKVKAGMEEVGKAFASGSGLGSTVAEFESSIKGVRSINSGKGDAGGASYGTYQLASANGAKSTLAAYLKQSKFGDQLRGLTPGTPAFNAKWLEIANKDPEGFDAEQKEFIKKTHFDPAIKAAAKMGFNTDDKAVQEMVWSGSIQHNGIKTILEQTKASRPNFDQLPPAEQVKAFYDARAKYALKAMSKNSSAAVIAGVQNRYPRELKKVLTLAGQSVSQEQAAKAATQGTGTTEATGAPAPPPMLAASGTTSPTPETGSAPDAVKAIQEKTAAAPPSLLAQTPTAPTAPVKPAAPTSTDALINNYAASSQIRPVQQPAAVTVGKTAEAAAVASTPVPKEPSVQTPAQQAIQVVDPEGKTQTNLLTQQNQLLAQMVSLLSGNNPKTGTPGEGVDNKVMISKLDGIINAIQSTGTLTAATSTGANGTLPADTGKRSIEMPSNKGINVSREVIS